MSARACREPRLRSCHFLYTYFLGTVQLNSKFCVVWCYVGELALRAWFHPRSAQIIVVIISKPEIKKKECRTKGSGQVGNSEYLPRQVLKLT